MHLLDLIAFKNNTLISDLKTPCYREKALLFILHMHPELCDIEEITEAINYLMTGNKEFEDIEECKEYIKTLLKEGTSNAI